VTLDLETCFREAWRGFKAWWIPLCLVAAVIVVVTSDKLVTRVLKKELTALQPYANAGKQYANDMLRDSTRWYEHSDRLLQTCSDVSASPTTQAAIASLKRKIFGILIVLAALIAILHVAMVIMAKASVTSRKERTLRRDFKRTVLLSISYTVMAVFKILPFCCCILPGLYIYTKLYFSDFIITEASANPFRAMAQSWRMTEGNFWRIFLLLLVTLVTHGASLLTMGLAEIPGRPFEYTLRAAAYRQLKARNSVPT
jgi:hypothetical protein